MHTIKVSLFPPNLLVGVKKSAELIKLNFTAKDISLIKNSDHIEGLAPTS